MEVILLKNVTKLGDVGDLVSVKGGYGRNYLLPQGFALAASTGNKRRLEHEKRIANFKRIKATEEASGQIGKLNKTSLSFSRKVGDLGKLFGSVTTMDIQSALEAEGIDVDRRKIQLTDAIKDLGEFKVAIKLIGDLAAEITVKVVAEEG